jgi:putative protease
MCFGPSDSQGFVSMSNSTTRRPAVRAHHDPAAFELVCPAGSLPALKAAVEHGADCVYLGFRDATNARNFAGLNFDERAIAQGIPRAASAPVGPGLGHQS